MRPAALALLAVGSFGCASAGIARPARSTLSAREAALLGAVAEKQGGGFARAWPTGGLPGAPFIIWDQDRSFVTPDAPQDLLQTVRDEVGRLNQKATTGTELHLAVTVFRYRQAGLFRSASAACELVARDSTGRLVWTAQDEVRADPDQAQSLADTPNSLIAREIARKLMFDVKRPVAARPDIPMADK